MTEIPNNNKDSAEDQKLDKTKQLVNGLFRKISENQSLPDSVNSIIQNLKTPYLKIALDTPNLFAFENHQARVFLDNACRISIEWAEIEDSNNSYLKKLEATVEKINNIERYNNKEFIQFQKDLEKSLEKIKKRAVIKEKRENEKLLGQQKIAKAKDDTTKIISQKISDSSKLPEYIEHILRDEWTNVLVLLHIRNGPESEIYKSKLEFIDLLLEAVIYHESLKDQKQKYKILFGKYQKGLALVAFNKQEINEKEIELLQFLKKLSLDQKAENTLKPENSVEAPNIKQKTPVENIKSEPKVEIYQIKPDSEEKKSDESLVKNKSKIPDNDLNQAPESKPKEFEKKFNELKQNRQPAKHIDNNKSTNTDNSKTEEKVDYNQIVASLKTGTWFEILAEEKNIIKAKLSWISPISGNHLFVDAHGLKIANKNIPELIQGLKDNSIKIIKAY